MTTLPEASSPRKLTSLTLVAFAVALASALATTSAFLAGAAATGAGSAAGLPSATTRPDFARVTS